MTRRSQIVLLLTCIAIAVVAWTAMDALMFRARRQGIADSQARNFSVGDFKTAADGEYGMVIGSTEAQAGAAERQFFECVNSACQPLPRGLSQTPDGRLLIQAGRFAAYPPCVEPACDTSPGQICLPKCAGYFQLLIDYAWEPLSEVKP